LAQDDYWYEIHLSNKQLVFYFMAAATGLILSFLAGVMVGRGVDAGPETAAVASTRAPRQEERVVTEEPVKPAPPSPEDLTYAQRLESERTEDALEKPGARIAARPPAAPPSSAPARSSAAASAAPVAKPTPAPARPVPTPAASARPAAVASARPPAAAAGSFTIQVGAFKDRAGADAVMTRLKGKGLPAYVQAASGGLYNVRVGSYATRPDADQVVARLREQEKLNPFIVRN
jgi:rare lipoprotein A